MAINDRLKISHKRTKVLIYGRLLKKSLHIQCHPLANYSLALYILNASHVITVNLPKSRNQCSDTKSVLCPFAREANGFLQVAVCKITTPPFVILPDFDFYIY